MGRGSETYLVPIQNVFPGPLGGKIPSNPEIPHDSWQADGYRVDMQGDEPGVENQRLPAQLLMFTWTAGLCAT